MSSHEDMVSVVVSFPLAGEPFKEQYSPDTKVAEVRNAAMSAFGVSEDSSTKYYLVHKNEPVNQEESLSSLAGHAKSVHFTLVKELVSGGSR